MAEVTLYKLTDENGQTKNQTQWGENVTHVAAGLGHALCSNAVIHAYEHPLIALFMNPIHAAFSKPQLWEARGEISVKDGQLKCGCKQLTTIKQLPIREITTVQRIAFGILATTKVYKNKQWRLWADNWISGKDRSRASAASAADDAFFAADAAADAAASAADDASAFSAADAAASASAAFSAASAAFFAADAASSTDAASAVFSATDAASAASAAADVAKISLIKIAEKAVTIK
jgi:hypothetical protein